MAAGTRGAMESSDVCASRFQPLALHALSNPAGSSTTAVTIAVARPSIMRSVLGAFIGLQLWIMFRSALLLLRLPPFSRDKQRAPAFQQRPSSNGFRVLITGRVDSRNWCMAHLLPLAQTANISELLLIVDGEIPAFPKARQFLI